LRVPKLFNLRTDPYERADTTSNTCCDRLMDHVFVFVPAQACVGQFLATFEDDPQRQKADSFNLDTVFAEAPGERVGIGRRRAAAGHHRVAGHGKL
jgi:hypothetical protein